MRRRGLDGVEIRTARTIAGVHGGKIAGSADTISTLKEEDIVAGQRVRSRLIAALLRLADELADDPARANRVGLAAGSLPVSSEVFHIFAANLHSQLPEAANRAIRLVMEFSDPTLFTRQLGKGEGHVFLLNEIFARSLKTYHEARYCSRFLRPYLDFERVSVEILIFDGDGPQVESIQYSLAESGYGDSGRTVYSLAPELEKFRGNGRLTAEHLASLLGPVEEPNQ